MVLGSWMQFHMLMATGDLSDRLALVLDHGVKQAH